MDTHALNLAVERLMAAGDTFDPADAELLRSTLPIQRLFSWTFKLNTPGSKPASGGSLPVDLFRFKVLHAVDPVFGVHRIDIWPTDRFEHPEPLPTARIFFNGQDKPTVIKRFARRVHKIELFAATADIGLPSWQDWKNPKDEVPAA